MQILGLMFMRNASPYVRRCLQHFAAHGIQVYVIDNESVDGSADIARGYVGRSVIDVEFLSYEGSFNLERLLTRAQEIANSSHADWLVRFDSDEILEPPRGFRTLREGIEAVDAQGYNVINFDEFVFIPPSEEENRYEGTDFVERMRYYYFFEPKPNRLQRAWKQQASGVDFVRTGGHIPHFANKRIYPEPFVLRHYMVLSRGHAIAKYGGRIYNVWGYMQHGWHAKRINFTPNRLEFPPRASMKQLGQSESWDKSDPKRTHAFLGRFSDMKHQWLQAPGIRKGSEPPAPFVVGAARSGTTLLRLMLDAHPDMAIPPETHILPALAEINEQRGDFRKRFVATLTSAPAWPALQLTKSDLEASLQQVQPFDLGEGVRAVYRLYASRHGKRRWGDKTPLYCRRMLTIARLLPEASFIHIIRDGRDVAVSGRNLWFGSGADMEKQAGDWVWTIRQTRQQAQVLQSYLEIRFEDLIRQPELTLRTVCDFIELPFHESMLEYHKRAHMRLRELTDRYDEEGRLVATAEMKRGIHARAAAVPDESRIGRWKSDMSAQERHQFEQVAGDMLRELGY